MSIVIESVGFDESLEMMEQAMLDHWEEVPFGSFDMKLNLHKEMYRQADIDGHARFYMAWDGSKPIAYMSLFASEMCQHQGTYQAVTDAYYVDPDYRKGGVFGKLLAFVEQDLASYGIRFLTVGVNPNFKGKTDEFLKATGYEVTEVSLTKEL